MTVKGVQVRQDCLRRTVLGSVRLIDFLGVFVFLQHGVSNSNSTHFAKLLCQFL